MSANIMQVIKRTVAVVVPVLAAIGLTAWLVASRTPPEKSLESEVVRAVAVIDAPRVAWTPRAVGYGVARPARSWPAVAEVAGRIVKRNPALESGAILPQGTVLYEIDRADYELAVTEAQAGIAALEARLRDLKTRKSHLQRALELERRRLEVARREFQRKETLLKKGTLSRSEVDREERSYLQQRQAVQDIETSVAQIPSERERLQAELAREQARLQQAERDLPRTRITAPFALRVSEVNAEADQYVRVGETLMVGDTIAATEVAAQVPVTAFRAILDPARRPSDISGPADLSRVLPAMGLTAEARLRTSGGTQAAARWPARVDRIDSAVDARTRTVGVVVTVERPYEQARPPEKPPLVKGMYVEVGVCAPARPRALVVPRAALHEGKVYVAGNDNRLEVRSVEVGYRYGDFAVITSGIEPGERIVVSDPVPAVAGMKLAPQTDEAALDALVAEAKGTQACP